MKVLFVEYPKCSTCKKAGKWLKDHDVEFDDRHIVEENPTAEELKEWHAKSGLPLKRFFNTSGQVYRNNGIKDKLPGMSEEEQYALLATDGMLVKRPIVVGEDFVLVGFKEKNGREVIKTLGWGNGVTSDRVFLQLYKDRNVTVASQNLYIFFICLKFIL